MKQDRRAVRTERWARPCLLALGGFALTRLMTPGAALAQCSTTVNPSPPPTLTENYVNQSFGAGAPYNLVNFGIAGCDGVGDQGDNSDGGPGFDGQPGGPIVNLATGVTIAGASFIDGFNSFGLAVVTAGGAGGGGGESGNSFGNAVFGGAGGKGGASGRIDIDFSGTLGPDAGNFLPETGMYISTRGGAGGTGGTTEGSGFRDQSGGPGGAGGTGGTIVLTGSGGLAAEAYAVIAVANGGNGGNGGLLSTSNKVIEITGGDAGVGGSGGTIALAWTSGAVKATEVGLFASAGGGFGGNGGSTGGSLSNRGGAGGSGGNGGSPAITLGGGSTVTISQADTASGGGIVAWAVGGAGGTGGSTGFASGTDAGSGGNGGTGGTASATILGTVDVTGLIPVLGTKLPAPVSAVFVNANGGAGGAGGSADATTGQGGGGGFAGAGGSASLTVGSATQVGTIHAYGVSTNAALVQSVGGGGGGGGQASFNAQGGAGAAGGDAGVAGANIVNGIVVAHGASSSALIVQSIGGGGGVGGNTADIALGYSVAIGGNGGLGGNGNNVTLNLSAASIYGSLDPLGDGGILAQSIGGAGGAGGSATSTGTGFVMTIGGAGNNGGLARDTLVTSAALVGTYGDHAAGIQAQSIGGGGGKGGSATSFSVALAVPSVAIAVGGAGGQGGVAGAATIVNSGEVSTFGPDAFGLIAQSVGGGGGSGGAAVARAISISPDKRIPAVSISVAMGGSGGSGNLGGAATIANSGIVTTAGDGSTAMMAQSIGGGGGTGGDSTASSYSGGDSGAVKVSVAVALGGAGGNGGIGGTATASNSNLLLTLGADAYGMVAQSVGGGGGIGGAGDASATAGKAKAGFSAAIAVGGVGGSGGKGSKVKADNDGGIATGGDAADGIFAQSIGGGGGAGGGGVGAANGPTLSISVGVGGNGGSGGDAGGVTALNEGGVVTRGTDAAGVFAQSVGGGGGKGGKGGATSGGVNPVNQAKALADNLAAGLNLDGSVTQPVDGIFKIAGIANEFLKSAEELEEIQKQLAGNPSKIGEADNLDVSVSVGGKGGAAGSGNSVTVANVGQISTFGAQSDGIFAQSVGGGGGKGGAATSTAKSANDGRNQAAIAVGGLGGAGGDGGAVAVTNVVGGSIVTRGVLGFAIVAQSVGGGGGSGGMAGAVAGSLRSLSVGIGGSGGAQGSGGAVTVANDGSITTGGKHGIGILAQSIGGGGGLVRTMTTDMTFDPGDPVNNPQGRAGDVHGVTLSFNGGTNPVGDAGAIQVNAAGSISTTGRTAHGIVAQSIGGGGGAEFGGQLVANNAAASTGHGNGNTVAVTMTAPGGMTTSGDGSYGILAQSIGGGGGLAGDLANVTDGNAGVDGSSIAAGTGSASNVTVNLTGTKIGTAGKFAPAVYAQSVGGGGGLLAVSGQVLSGTARGSGAGGEAVTVSLVDTVVRTTGLHSPAIMMQNAGSTSGAAVVNIDAKSVAFGGRTDTNTGEPFMAGAIFILDGTANVINNAGSITGIDDVIPAIAINVIGGDVAVINTGLITGSVLTNGPEISIDNRASGIFDARDRIELGAGGVFTNAGTLEVGGTKRSGTTVLTGDLIQTSTGHLVLAADLAGGESDLLTVIGHATIAGTVTVQPTSVTNRAVTVLTATQGVTLDPGLTAAPRLGLYSLQVAVVGNALQVRPAAFFSAGATGLGRNRQRVAENLQSLFDGGASLDAGFSALADIKDAPGFARALTSLAAPPLGGIAAFRFTSSRGFVDAMASGCTTPADDDSCVWSRASGDHTTIDSHADASGYSVRTNLFQVGGQREVSEHWSLGSSLAYEHTRFAGEGRYRALGNSALAGADLRYLAGPWQASAAFDIGYGWYSAMRAIDVGNRTGITATAKPRAWNVGLHGALAYRQPVGATSYVKPFADVHVARVHSDGFVEGGLSPFNLAVASRGQVAAASGGGIEIGSAWAIGEATIVRPFASAAVVFLSDDWAANVRYAVLPGSAAGFRAGTSMPGRLGKFNVGAELLTGRRFALRFAYTPEIGEHYTTHAGSARLSYMF